MGLGVGLGLGLELGLGLGLRIGLGLGLELTCGVAVVARLTEVEHAVAAHGRRRAQAAAPALEMARDRSAHLGLGGPEVTLL